MPESTKTLLFVVAAVASVGAAIASRPSTTDYDPSDLLGTNIAPSFAPDDAKRLSIAKFDEETATMETFEVADQEGVWTLPSKGGYPADAARQLAEAITGVTDREILNVASEDPNNHADFGVIDPTSPKLEPGTTGVGQRVSLAKEDGSKLVDLIIGKEVKDQDGQRYVRRGEQDVVFIIDIDTESFSTDFADWIEDDLLKISPFDIQRVRIKDYSSELFLTLQGLAAENTFRSEIDLVYDDGESEWKLEQLRVAQDPRAGDFKPAEVGDDQELDDDKLGDLKNALDDLKIVDVASKPEGLSASLKAGEEFLNDAASLRSLVDRGFAPTRNDAGELDLLSSEGEVICTMKDGVEYVLRFGNLEIDTSSPDSSSADAGGADSGDDDADGEGDDDADDGVNRYLFVMARFNESAVEPPELAEVPELPEGAEAPAEDEDAEAAEGDEATEADEETAEDGDGADKSDDADEPTELEKAITERKEVEQENARLLEEYQDELVEGRQRVKELNDRFGDWYYVVSDDVFRKIRLGKDDVLKQKEPEDDEAADDDDEAADNSAFGAPGAAVPGLPGINLPGIGEPAAEPEASGSATSEPAPSEPAPSGEAAAEGAAAGNEAEAPPTAAAETSPAAEAPAGSVDSESAAEAVEEAVAEPVE